MGIFVPGRIVRPFVVFAALAACSACDHHCGLGERDRVTARGSAPFCGAGVFSDVALKGETSDAEFSLVNTAKPSEPVDAFIVPTTCAKLFDGPYPGAAPLCTIHAGPTKPGGVSARVKLAPGTYRVYVQGYSNVTQPVGYLVDVYIWDYSCRPLIQ